jgi:hypothetical protein
MRWWLACGACLLLGCSDSDSDSDSELTIDDGGVLCLRSAGEQRLDVQVLFPTCRSSSCDRVTSAGCSVVRSGGEIRVESRIVIDRERSRDICTGDCLRDTADCFAGGLEAGIFELVYGDARATVTLPTDALRLFPNDSPLARCD